MMDEAMIDHRTFQQSKAEFVFDHHQHFKMHHRGYSPCLSGKIVRNADEVLDNLQERVDNWRINQAKITNELSLYPSSVGQIIQTVNDRCDRMISIVEEHRQDVLDEIQRQSTLYTAELEKRLKECTQRVQSAQDLLTKCTKVVREDTEKFNESYQLISLYTLIGKQQSCVNIRAMFQPRFSINLYSACVAGMPWQTGYEGVEGGAGYFERIGDESCLDFKANIDFKANDNIYVDIPLRQQCQIVVENWCRKACGISNPPLLVIAAIDKFSPLGSIDESFVENLKKDASPCFIISQRGQQCTLREDFDYTHSILDSLPCIFGTVIASKGCKYHWKLQVMDIPSTFYIGVVSNSNFDSWMFREGPAWWNNSDKYSHYSYASDDGNLRCNGARSIEYGDSYGSGDIIEIVLDMRDGTIMFGKNGVFYGRHSADLMVRDYRGHSAQTYRLAIGSYCWERASVRLLSCTRTGLLEDPASTTLIPIECYHNDAVHRNSM